MKKTNLNTLPDFSFDRKDEDFLSSKNSRQTPEKKINKFANQSPENEYDSEDSDKIKKKNIKEIEMKYNRENNQNK